MAERGWRKLEDLIGARGKIVVDTRTGTFKAIIMERGPRADIPVWETEGNDLREVRQKANEFIAGCDTVKWKPVILIDRIYTEDEPEESSYNMHHIELEYTRLFEGKTAVGKRVWKNTKHEDRGKGLDVTDVEPGALERGPYDMHNKVVIPYTPERWQALRRLTRMIQSINHQLAKVIRNAKEAEKFLSVVADHKTEMLRFIPHKDGK